MAVRILWDEPKRRKVLAERGLDLAGVTVEFLAGAVTVARRGDLRLVVGMLRGRAVAVVYLPLGSEAISVVTMRPASVKERSLL
jgi:uncharacterized DUF497 family protein